MTASQTSNKNSVDVIVVGSGHNGLIAACYLAKSGLDVLVLEAHETAGGMTATNPMAPEAPDHLINEASIHASMFHMSPIDKELELGSKYGLRQRKIDPCHVQLNPNGDESLALWRDPKKTAEEIAYFSKKDAKAYLELCELWDIALDIGLPFALGSPSNPGFGRMAGAIFRSLRHVRKLPKLAGLIRNSHAGLLEEIFDTEMARAPWTSALPFMNFTADMGAFSMVYVGVLQRWGVTMFEGGTGAFPAALIRCLEANKGKVRCNAPVAEIIVRQGAAKGVRLHNGEEILANKGVLTAFSPKAVLNHLLPEGTLPADLERRAKNIPTSSRGVSDFKLNMAFKGKITPRRHQAWRNKRDGLDLRLPTTQWGTHQGAIDAYNACVKGEIPEMIPGQVQITTAFDESMAPPGHDTLWFWSGLVPFAPNQGWDEARPIITDQIVRNISEVWDGIEEFEIARRPLVAPDIEKRFRAIDGSVYHVDPLISRFGPGRPAPGLANYKTPVVGLFLSGSGTHPNAGICGLPGRNSALAMIKSLK